MLSIQNDVTTPLGPAEALPWLAFAVIAFQIVVLSIVSPCHLLLCAHLRQWLRQSMGHVAFPCVSVCTVGRLAAAAIVQRLLAISMAACPARARSIHFLVPFWLLRWYAVFHASLQTMGCLFEVIFVTGSLSKGPLPGSLTSLPLTAGSILQCVVQSIGWLLNN